MSSPFEAAAAEARRQIQEHVDALKEHPSMREILRLHPGLNAIEQLMQQEPTSLGSLLGLSDLAPGGSSPLSRVRFDDFVGLPPLEAAKKYLKKATDARPFQEIVDAIKAGNGKIDSEDELRVGLSRSTLDIVKIGDRYGLLEHYPHIKRGGKKRKESSTAIEKPEPADDAATSGEGDADTTEKQ
jgi:hypothetical protein